MSGRQSSAGGISAAVTGRAGKPTMPAVMNARSEPAARRAAQPGPGCATSPPSTTRHHHNPQEYRSGTPGVPGPGKMTAAPISTQQKPQRKAVR
jgi:hypothetical protein